jgi:signal transduction histidine kinase
MIFSIAYAILKYRLFDIKLILVELAVLLLNLFLFINIFLSQRGDILILNAAIFVAVLIFSVLLLRRIYGDIRDRERIQELVKEVVVANERLRRSEEQKSEFISIASHQLRTPLTVIKGYASMMLEGSFGRLGSEVHSAVGKLFQATQIIVSLVEDILTLSRIERGKNVLTFASVNIYEVVTEVVNEMNGAAKEAGLALTLDSTDRGLLIQGDRNKLKQVLRHLVSNALQFTHAGFVRVHLSYDEGTQCSRIVVSDTGMGIAGEKLDSLFDHFSTITPHPKGTRSTGSSSFGLYLVKEIVKAHHGKVWAESAGIGQGATFIVEIPFQGNKTLGAESI